MDARTCVDGVDARERVEMGGEKDWWARGVWVQGKGWRWVGRRAGGCGWCGGKGKGHEGAWIRGGVDGVECKGKGGNGQGEGRERVEMGGEREGWP